MFFGAMDGWSLCKDGDQIAVPAGASWQLYQLHSDAYPTCDKTALAEYNLSSKAESRLPCCHRGRLGVPNRHAVGTPAQPHSSCGLVVRFTQARHQRCRSYHRPSSCTSCWRCLRRHLSRLDGPVFSPSAGKIFY